MATVSASLFRGPGFMRPSQTRRCRPCCAPKSPFPFMRAMRAPPRAFGYRGGGFSSSDEPAMKALFEELARQWRQHKGSCGGTMQWPGGSCTFGLHGGCRPHHGKQDTSRDAAGADESSSTSTPQLQLDVTSGDGVYLLFADVPGLSKADLTIKLSKEPRVLTISGNRPVPVEEGFVQRERRFGQFQRQWTLPDDADTDGITAKVTAGQLTVSVPKRTPQPEVDDSEEIFIA